MSVPGLRREDFPVLDRLTYLNTASAGLVPASVLTPAHEFEAKLAQAGTTGMDEDTEIGILDDARHGAAALLGASPDTIAIATSFTEALNQVAWWLRPGRGQNIVSSEVDFPSVTYPWHRIAEDTGCQVRLVGVLDDPDSFDVNKIAGSVDSATLDARWLPLAASARRMEYSTMSYAAAIALGRAIGYISGLSLAGVAAHNRELASQLADGLAQRGAHLLTPRDPARRAGTVTARFPGHDGEAIAAALTKRGVIVSPRVGSARFSVHFYNSSDDVSHALATLDKVLR